MEEKEKKTADAGRLSQQEQRIRSEVAALKPGEIISISFEGMKEESE